MNKLHVGFPGTEAEKEYVDAATSYKEDLRKLLESAPEYTPGVHSDKLSGISALLGQRKKESMDAFDKFTGEILGEIDEKPLIQQEKVLGRKGSETMRKK